MIRALVALIGCAACRLVYPDIAAAADPANEPPDPAFLEYLGSWQGDDDAWVLLQGADPPASDRAHASPQTPDPKGKDEEPKHQDDKQRNDDE